MRYAMFILYVRDQQASRDFYAKVLQLEPSLDVPGMTEFELSSGAFLGLMPEAGIKRLLGDAMADPALASAAPRCELYLPAADPQVYLDRLVSSGGRLLSAVQPRNWGDDAGYGVDPDGHVIAFARKSIASENSSE